MINKAPVWINNKASDCTDKISDMYKIKNNLTRRFNGNVKTSKLAKYDVLYKPFLNWETNKIKKNSIVNYKRHKKTRYT